MAGLLDALVLGPALQGYGGLMTEEIEIWGIWRGVALLGVWLLTLERPDRGTWTQGALDLAVSYLATLLVLV